jgi:DNA-binding NtrC family response regulator
MESAPWEDASAGPAPPRLLFAEDSGTTRAQLGRLLEADPGVPVDGVADGQGALQALAARRYGAVLTDLRMPHLGGLQLLEALHRQQLRVPIIVLTGCGDVADATRAMRLGAYDFLTKPVDIEVLRRTVGRALAEHAPADEPVPVPGAGRGARAFHGLLSKNPGMHAVFALVARAARSTSTVLIEGETGTGKERVARALHRATRGRDGPLVAVSCAAVPGPLLESEFFGHEKGAFTDAAGQRIGRFEQADRGTLFLDEVDALPPSMQAKLLRVLQERCFERVGGTEEVHTNVRVVAASVRPLARLVKEGKFREDLYYRLNVVRIDLPPLRERPEDVPWLACHFAARSAAPGGPRTLSPEALGLLQAYSWPGNIRELENAIERACILARGETVQPEDLPAEVLRPARMRAPVEIDLSLSLLQQVADARSLLEEHYLRAALRKCGGNISRCAAVCGLSRRSVARKLAAYGIEKALFKERS